MTYLCPNCNGFSLEDYVWWVTGRKHTKWWCATCGEKYDWKHLDKALNAWKISTEVAQGFVEARQQSEGVRSFPAVVGRGPLAFFWMLGQCAFTHSLYAVEPRKVRAIWRALLLPFGEGANGPQGVGPVGAQYPSRKSESMCLDRFCTW